MSIISVFSLSLYFATLHFAQLQCPTKEACLLSLLFSACSNHEVVVVVDEDDSRSGAK